jgi:hypothetical protein
MKNLQGKFNVEMERENIFQPTIWNDSLQEEINNSGVRIVNFATPKSLVVKCTTVSHRKFHKHTWTSPDGRTHNQIYHMLLDGRWHSSILNVLSFIEPDCDTDQYPVVAIVRERLAVKNQNRNLMGKDVI